MRRDGELERTVIRISTCSHRIGLLMAMPLVMLTLVLAGIAIWEARPLPACFAGGVNPLNPTYRCRHMTIVGGVPVRPLTVTESGSVRRVEQGSVSGMPDFSSAGFAALAAFALYGISRALGWLVGQRPLTLKGWGLTAPSDGPIRRHRAF